MRRLFREPRKMRKIRLVNAWKLRSEGSYSRNDPGVWLVYSDSTRRGAYAQINVISQRVANSGIRALWIWKFWPKISTFSAMGPIFAALGRQSNFRGPLRSQAIAWFSDILYPIPLWLNKCQKWKNRIF